MIVKTAANRRLFTDYLENCSEDALIDDVVIPLFNYNGYTMIRKVTHGPGEHGKDVIFSKFNPSFLDMEYLVVQAKAINVTAGNVVEFSNQLIRALRNPITGLNGVSNVYPNYVVFLNSKRISNDAHFEFPYLIDGKSNVKLLHQDNVVELMMTNSIIPESIARQITIQNRDTEAREKQILDIISNNKANEVDTLFNIMLPVYDELTNEIKAMIIEYIFNLWSEDKSWEGTIRPMKWLNRYFEYVQPNQYPKMYEVCKEYFSDYHSYAARSDTISVFRKINSDIISTFKSDYVLDVATIILNNKDDEIAFSKISELTNDGLSGSSLFQMGRYPNLPATL